LSAGFGDAANWPEDARLFPSYTVLSYQDRYKKDKSVLHGLPRMAWPISPFFGGDGVSSTQQ
jgi:hypothetical protein